VLRSSEVRKPKDIKTVKCRNCGSENFIVGKDLFFTAIKCKKCGLESCIHEG
jgi:ribosomal protein L37E